MSIYKLVVTAIAAALLTASCARVDLLNALTPNESFTKQTEISYGALPSQKLDIYKSTKPKTNAPTVMFIYGGGWHEGSKDIYKFIGEAFTSAGFDTVIPTYRTYPDVTYPDFVTDTAAALAWSHKNIDGPIVMVGHSAGAHIAALLALDPTYLAAHQLKRCNVLTGWTGLAGPYDFKIYDEPYLSIFPENLRAREILPISYAQNTVVPAQLLIGKDDETVQPAQTERLGEAIKQAGGKASVRLYDDTNHLEVMLRLSDFFRDKGTVHQDVTGFIDSLPSQASCAK